MGSRWAGQLSARSRTDTGGWVCSAFSCPLWHHSLGRRAAPWPLASMGHSNSVITSWCFVNVGVARDELWLSTLKYGSSCRAILQSVKCRSESGACLLPPALDINTVSFMTSLVVTTCHRVNAGVRCYWPQRGKEETRGLDEEKHGTAVVRREAVRQQLVTVSDKYRGLWSSLMELCLRSLLEGEGRVASPGSGFGPHSFLLNWLWICSTLNILASPMGQMG